MSTHSPGPGGCTNPSGGTAPPAAAERVAAPTCSAAWHRYQSASTQLEVSRSAQMSAPARELGPHLCCLSQMHLMQHLLQTQQCDAATPLLQSVAGAHQGRSEHCLGFQQAKPAWAAAARVILARLAYGLATSGQLSAEVSQSKSDLLSSSVLSKSSCMHLSNVIPGIIEPCTAVLSIRSMFCKLQRLSDWSRHLQAAYPFIPAVSVKDCCQTLT